MSEHPRPAPDDPIASALRRAFADEIAPDGLNQRLARSLQALPTTARRAPARHKPALTAVVVVVAIIVGIATWRPHTSELADGPLKELQAFIDSNRAVDVATNDPAQVHAWLAQRVGFNPPPVARGSGAIELVGGRLCIFSGRRVASYMYRVRGRLISIYVMAADGLRLGGKTRTTQAGTMLVLTQEGSLSQASWTADGLIYSAVGELPELALLTALDELRPPGG
jgi:hypothetical protein